MAANVAHGPAARRRLHLPIVFESASAALAAFRAKRGWSLRDHVCSYLDELIPYRRATADFGRRRAERAIEQIRAA